MLVVIEAPQPIKTEGLTVFLAGSIEMGAAIEWQQKLINALIDNKGTILNPRRKDWDSTWVQNSTCPQFVEQVNWELDAMEKADLIVFYFDPATKSPITLLELGLFARSKKGILVCCPPEFWRSGNIQIVCERYGLTGISTFEALTKTLQGVMI